MVATLTPTKRLPLLGDDETKDELERESRLSPEYVRISAAAAMELGLKRGRMMRGCSCGCINLLQTYGRSCASNCTYCGLARERPGLAEEKSFIRVDWPVYATELVAQRIAEREKANEVGRICVSQVQDPRAYEDLITICTTIHKAAPTVPMSALVSATTLTEERLAAVEESGVDIVGIGLDAATPELFDEVRGKRSKSPHRWDHHWKIARAARKRFGPMKVNCHVMVGLGETDRDLVELFFGMKEEQIAAYLFSFNPEEGTAMGDRQRASLERWRRIQLVKYLIEERGLSREAIEFDDDGAIAHLDAPDGTTDAVIDAGRAFMTNGCPDRHGEMTCNRPFGSYRPGEEFRDYPFVPNAEDVAEVRAQMRLDEIRTRR